MTSKQDRKITNAPPPIVPVRGTGYLPRTKKPIDWAHWRLMPIVQLHQAVALSVNVNPDDVVTRADAVMIKRMRVATSHIAAGSLVMEHLVHNNQPTVLLAKFSAWAVKLNLPDLPPELVAMAAPETPTEPAQTAAAPSPVVIETKEQRQDRRLAACEAAGLVMPMSSAGRLPDGVGDVADLEGITRQSFSTDVKAALARREITNREGMTVHRA